MLAQLQTVIQNYEGVLDKFQAKIINFESLKQAVLVEELVKELTILRNLLEQDPNTIKRFISDRCRQRLNREQVISPTYYPFSDTNEMYREIAEIIWSDEQIVFSVLYPDTKRVITLSVTENLPEEHLRRNSWRSFLRAVKKGTATCGVKIQSVPLANDILAINRETLPYLVFSEDKVLDVRQFNHLSLVSLADAFEQMNKTFPALFQELLCHHEIFTEASQDINWLHEYGLSPRQAIAQLAQGLRLGGNHLGGGSYARDVSLRAVERFVWYCQHLPQDIKEQIESLANGSTTIGNTVQLVRQQGMCVEQAANILREILQGHNAPWLNQTLAPSREALNAILTKYTPGNRLFSVKFSPSLKTILPTHLIAQSLNQINISHLDDFIILMINIPEYLYEAVLRAIKIENGDAFAFLAAAISQNIFDYNLATVCQAAEKAFVPNWRFPTIYSWYHRTNRRSIINSFLAKLDKTNPRSFVKSLDDLSGILMLCASVGDFTHFDLIWANIHEEVPYMANNYSELRKFWHFCIGELTSSAKHDSVVKIVEIMRHRVDEFSMRFQDYVLLLTYHKDFWPLELKTIWLNKFQQIFDEGSGLDIDLDSLLGFLQLIPAVCSFEQKQEVMTKLSRFFHQLFDTPERFSYILSHPSFEKYQEIIFTGILENNGQLLFTADSFLSFLLAENQDISKAFKAKVFQQVAHLILQFDWNNESLRTAIALPTERLCVDIKKSLINVLTPIISTHIDLWGLPLEQFDTAMRENLWPHFLNHLTSETLRSFELLSLLRLSMQQLSRAQRCSLFEALGQDGLRYAFEIDRKASGRNSIQHLKSLFELSKIQVSAAQRSAVINAQGDFQATIESVSYLLYIIECKDTNLSSAQKQHIVKQCHQRLTVEPNEYIRMASLGNPSIRKLMLKIFYPSLIERIDKYRIPVVELTGLLTLPDNTLSSDRFNVILSKAKRSLEAFGPNQLFQLLKTIGRHHRLTQAQQDVFVEAYPKVLDNGLARVLYSSDVCPIFLGALYQLPFSTLSIVSRVNMWRHTCQFVLNLVNEKRESKLHSDDFIQLLSLERDVLPPMLRRKVLDFVQLNLAILINSRSVLLSLLSMGSDVFSEDITVSVGKVAISNVHVIIKNSEDLFHIFQCSMTIVSLELRQCLLDAVCENLNGADHLRFWENSENLIKLFKLPIELFNNDQRALVLHEAFESSRCRFGSLLQLKDFINLPESLLDRELCQFVLKVHQATFSSINLATVLFLAELIREERSGVLFGWLNASSECLLYESLDHLTKFYQLYGQKLSEQQRIVCLNRIKETLPNIFDIGDLALIIERVAQSEYSHSLREAVWLKVTTLFISNISTRPVSIFFKGDIKGLEYLVSMSAMNAPWRTDFVATLDARLESLLEIFLSSPYSTHHFLEKLFNLPLELFSESLRERAIGYVLKHLVINDSKNEFCPIQLFGLPLEKLSPVLRQQIVDAVLDAGAKICDPHQLWNIMSLSAHLLETNQRQRILQAVSQDLYDVNHTSFATILSLLTLQPDELGDDQRTELIEFLNQNCGFYIKEHGVLMTLFKLPLTCFNHSHRTGLLKSLPPETFGLIMWHKLYECPLTVLDTQGRVLIIDKFEQVYSVCPSIIERFVYPFIAEGFKLPCELLGPELLERILAVDIHRVIPFIDCITTLMSTAPHEYHRVILRAIQGFWVDERMGKYYQKTEKKLGMTPKEIILLYQQYFPDTIQSIISDFKGQWALLIESCFDYLLELFQLPPELLTLSHRDDILREMVDCWHDMLESPKVIFKLIALPSEKVSWPQKNALLRASHAVFTDIPNGNRTHSRRGRDGFFYDSTHDGASSGLISLGRAP